MRKLLPVLLVFISAVQLRAQSVSPAIILEKDYYEVQAGDTLQFHVATTSVDSLFQLKAYNLPATAHFDVQAGKLSWLVPADFAAKSIAIEFELNDTTGKVIDKAWVVANIKKPQVIPGLVINLPDSIDASQPIKLKEGQRFEFNASIKAPNGKPLKQVTLSYIINNDVNIRSLKGARIQVIRDKLFFSWTPTHEQAQERFFSFQVNALGDGWMNSQTLDFQVMDKNQPPAIVYPLEEQYQMIEGQALNIQFNVNDPDGDKLTYSMDIPTNVGNPTIGKTSGQFQWQVDYEDMRLLEDQFPVEVTLSAREANTPEGHQVSSSFQVIHSDRNYPPQIRNLADINAWEGETVRRRIYIEDRNHPLEALEVQLQGAPDSLSKAVRDNYILLEWKPGFDEVGMDYKPKVYHVRLMVTDPQGARDEKFFEIKVNHNEDPYNVYENYQNYRKEVLGYLSQLDDMNDDLERQQEKRVTIKRWLSGAAVAFTVFTAGGSLYGEHTVAKEAIPFVAFGAATSTGINSFAFKEDYESLKDQVTSLMDKLKYKNQTLKNYDVKSEDSQVLQSVDFKQTLKNYRNELNQETLTYKDLIRRYNELDYVKRQKKRAQRRSQRKGKRAQRSIFNIW